MARRPVFAVRNGWQLRKSRAFAEVMDALEMEVERWAAADPDNYLTHPKAKLFVRITDIILEEIPADPSSSAYALGNTLGPAHRHWRRAKFLQRFRLFFRFDSASRTIIYSWVNDENTLHKAGSRKDPYSVFGQRLMRGDPPDSWEDLLRDSDGR
jgi:toxin YhaV